MHYFEHSVNAATDPKIMRLRLEFGGAAVDAYWYLVEHMHAEERGICMDDAGAMRVHCHQLCTDEKTLRGWVEGMVSAGLLELADDGRSVVSRRTVENVAAYKEKREKASGAASARWGGEKRENPRKPSSKAASKKAAPASDASAMQAQCERNADAMRPHEEPQCGGKPSAMPIKQNKTKVLNTHKGYSNTDAASGGAAAAGAAPPSAGKPFCPLCDVEMWKETQTGSWHCPNCQDAFRAEKAVWR